MRVCQKENIEKELRGRFIRIGKILHVEENKYGIVKMMDTGKITKKNVCDLKVVYANRFGGGCDPL